ncbi:MAG: DegT/DnrJ/EryC1/StrS family aminotransferase [Vulcanimicrobiota bacterium]
MARPEVQMVDLKTEYQQIKEEVDQAVLACLESTAFIKGPDVVSFEAEFAEYLGVKHVISCANGTDALQLALMALELKPGDEVIVPAFTYVATAEVVSLLGLTPVMVDVDPDTFNVERVHVERAITQATKAIVPVHLFGQCVDMDPLLEVAKEHGIPVIEDTAQAIGADYTGADGVPRKAGTIGTIGCTSFFPTKNLGCYGDGGAIMTNDDELAHRLRMISNHGQERKYYHDIVGVNSRLDTLQAAILRIKLRRLKEYVAARQRAAAHYDKVLADCPGIQAPARHPRSSHSFHQYTLKVERERRDAMQAYLQEKGVPTNVYYPLPLHHQKAFADLRGTQPLTVSEQLSEEVVSLPMHTQLTQEQLEHVTSNVAEYCTRELGRV